MLYFAARVQVSMLKTVTDGCVPWRGLRLASLVFWCRPLLLLQSTDIQIIL
jgi:hypothetical protein